MIGTIGFDKDGIAYGLLYADARREFGSKEIIVEWNMKFYSSEISRRRNLNKHREPGKPIFLFELTVKQVADMGHPLPFVPDERNREYHAPTSYNGYLFKK